MTAVSILRLGAPGLEPGDAGLSAASLVGNDLFRLRMALSAGVLAEVKVAYPLDWDVLANE
jgi:hypothetical protein